MTTNKFLAFLPTCLLLLSACDEASSSLPDPGSDLRDETLKKQKQPTGISFAVKIIPWDEGGGGGIGPLFHFEQVLRNADSMFGAAYSGSLEAREFCAEACDEEGMVWRERVSAEGEYDLGDISEYEMEDGTLGLQAEVRGEVSLVCHCEEG